MIGQNDVPGEVFGLDDANQLVAFADTAQARAAGDVVGQPGPAVRAELPRRHHRVRCLQRHRPDGR